MRYFYIILIIGNQKRVCFYVDKEYPTKEIIKKMYNYNFLNIISIKEMKKVEFNKLIQY